LHDDAGRIAGRITRALVSWVAGRPDIVIGAPVPPGWCWPTDLLHRGAIPFVVFKLNPLAELCDLPAAWLAEYLEILMGRSV